MSRLGLPKRVRSADHPHQPGSTSRLAALRPPVLRIATLRPAALRIATVRPAALRIATLRPGALRPAVLRLAGLRPFRPTALGSVMAITTLVALTGVTATATASGATVHSAAVPAAAAAATTYTSPVTRQSASLNASWKFLKSNPSGAQAVGFNDSKWGSVNLPHDWNVADGADGGNNYYRGVGWYRRHYTVPSSYAGKALYLQFAGVNQVADVWVNGIYLGEHKGGYSMFRFVATSALKVGQDNVIAVKVNNAVDPGIAPLSADYTMDGGIYRDVTLLALDPLSLRMLDYAGPGVYLTQRSVTSSSAVVDVTSKVFNNNASAKSVAVRTVITDAKGNVVADTTSATHSIGGASEFDFQQTVTIANPHRWDGVVDPYLYKANAEVRDVSANKITDTETEPLGLRTFSISASKGFSLNGHYLDLHGVDVHQDHGGVGWATTDAMHTADYAMIKDIGATAIRMAHYEHAQKEYDLADSIGLVVWTEVPNINNTTNSAAYTANVEQQLYELIRQNYNHPSIVFWGLGNEQDSNDAATNNLLASLAGIVKAQDPNRLSTYANCCVSDTSTVTQHSDVVGYNRYWGWYSGATTDLGPWIDKLHASEPNRPIALSEYGAGASTTQHALNPPEPAHGGKYHPEEYQAILHEQSWAQLKTRPYIWGKFVWNMFDFASDGRSEGTQNGINDKGLVTRDRSIEKDAFFFYKASWSSSPTLYITSRRWVDRTTAATHLKVYSNGSTVTAKLNGTSLGSRTSSNGNRIFTWTNVTLRKGSNTVVVNSTIGGKTYTDTVTWKLS